MNNEKVQYWTKMRDKAGRNLSVVSEHTEPEDEGDVKDALACVLKHGKCREMAEAILEACEWVSAHLELEKHHTVAECAVGVVK